MTVQEVVKLYRNQSGLSLRRFAEVVGVSHEQVRNWESGKYPPPGHGIIMPLLRGEYGDWRTRFAVDVLSALYPTLIKPVGDGRPRANRGKQNSNLKS